MHQTQVRGRRVSGFLLAVRLSRWFSLRLLSTDLETCAHCQLAVTCEPSVISFDPLGDSGSLEVSRKFGCCHRLPQLALHYRHHRRRLLARRIP